MQTAKEDKIVGRSSSSELKKKTFRNGKLNLFVENIIILWSPLTRKKNANNNATSRYK